MVISTRSSQQQPQLDILVEDVQNITRNGISTTIGSQFTPANLGTTDVNLALNDLNNLVSYYSVVSQQLWNDLVIVSADNVVMSHKVDMFAEVIEDLRMISYDEDLDHATADLMDAICASGAADVSDDGDLVFDSTVRLSKADLRPILREALNRWIDLKLR